MVFGFKMNWVQKHDKTLQIVSTHYSFQVDNKCGLILFPFISVEAVLSLNTLFGKGLLLMCCKWRFVLLFNSCFAYRLAPKRRHVRWLERKLKDLNLYKERQQTILDMIKKRLSQANPNNLPKAANLDSDTISVSSEVFYCPCVT